MFYFFYFCVLWDVDGIIVDVFVGIFCWFDIVLIYFGYLVFICEEFVYWIGFLMFQLFQDQVGMMFEQFSEVVVFYCMFGKVDGYMMDVVIYFGVMDLIYELYVVGILQVMVSLKLENQVDVFVDYFGLCFVFLIMVGVIFDEVIFVFKMDIVVEVLWCFCEFGVDMLCLVLVGDWYYDVEGGNVNGVLVIFVEWGFSDFYEGDDVVYCVVIVVELCVLLLS